MVGCSHTFPGLVQAPAQCGTAIGQTGGAAEDGQGRRRALQFGGIDGQGVARLPAVDARNHLLSPGAVHRLREQRYSHVMPAQLGVVQQRRRRPLQGLARQRLLLGRHGAAQHRGHHLGELLRLVQRHLAQRFAKGLLEDRVVEHGDRGVSQLWLVASWAVGSEPVEVSLHPGHRVAVAALAARQLAQQLAERQPLQHAADAALARRTWKARPKLVRSFGPQQRTVPEAPSAQVLLKPAATERLASGSVTGVGLTRAMRSPTPTCPELL